MSARLTTSNKGLGDDSLQQLVGRILKRITAEDELIHRSLCHEEDIIQDLLQTASNRTEKDTLHAFIIDFYDRVQHQVHSKAQSDTQGIGKFSTKVSDFAKWTKDFFEEYSAIAEIARGIHNNFGAIAYGTFSVFLVVAQSKAVRQEQIQAVLNELGVWLPRIKVFRSRDRHHPRLTRLLLVIYGETIHFFQYATKFLCSSRLYRARELISPKSKKELQEILDNVKEKTKQLLEELVVRLYEQNDEMATQIARIGQSLEEQRDITMKRARDRHHGQMQRIVKLLGLQPNFDDFVAAMISYCDCQDYQARFKFHKKAAFPPVRLQQVSLKDLRQRDEYRNWMNAARSSILLLGGENVDIGIPQSWLSPVSTELFHSLEQSTACIVVYHSINGARLDVRYPSPEHEVLLAIKSILYQILNSNSSLCQQFCEQFSQVGSPVDPLLVNETQIEEHIRAWIQVLSETVQSRLFEARPLYIILDGLEQLSAPAPRTFLESVLNLLDECDTGPTIKIMAICSTLNLSNIRDSNDTQGLRYALGQGGNTRIMERVFADLFWNQPIWKDDFMLRD